MNKLASPGPHAESVTRLAPRMAGQHIRGEESTLGPYCRQIFQSLSRSDQRRCAESYLYGLLYGRGRRSSRRMSASPHVLHTDQALQQFVNQSPWKSAVVRQQLVEYVSEMVTGRSGGERDVPEPATAWTLHEVAFVKNGRCSVGVERQFVPTLGRVANSQVAAALSITGTDFSVPINWRLQLPLSWDSDDARRWRAKVPAEERHKSYWEHLVSLVDEMTNAWQMSSRPIVADLSRHAGAEEFMAALQDRGLAYIVKVHPRQEFRSMRAGTRDNVRSLRPAGALVQAAARQPRQTVTWRSGRAGRVPRSQFLAVPVRAATLERSTVVGRARLTQLVAEWPFDTAAASAMWVTNLVATPLAELVRLAKLELIGRQSLDELAERLGLQDFEGRSYGGWHHHVTLVSAARAFLEWPASATAASESGQPVAVG